MTTIYVQGTVTPPTTANAVGAYGYDNAGYFGPSFADLAGDPFLVTWTGTPCNCWSGPGLSLAGIPSTPSTILDATLTINGITLDLGAFHNIQWSLWRDLEIPPYHEQFIQTTTFNTPTFPPTGGPSSHYALNTQSNYPGGAGGIGVAYLSDSYHSYSTDMFLTVGHIGPDFIPNFGVPGPGIGDGLTGLIAVAVCAALIARHRRHNKLEEY